MNARAQSLADVTCGSFGRKAPALRAMHKHEPIFVGVSGGEGSYTKQAAEQYVKRIGLRNCTFEPLVFVKDVLEKLHEKHIDVGIFGIVNSSGGVVEEYMPYLGHFRWDFVEIIQFEVNHMLLALPGFQRSDIAQIASQEQAMRQCPTYLATNWPDVEQIAYIDTATAAQHLSEGSLPPSTAVIASAACAKLYGLDILDERIQDKKPNITSFIVAQPFE